MREIKFRALSMCMGERWVYGDLRHYARNPHTEKWTIHDPATGLETDIDETTIGQFTGLRDINGKEIYEGDIFDLREFRIKVVYEVDMGRFVLMTDVLKSWMLSLDKAFCSHYAIVGNIHDNPEMMKGGRL